jgi:hypothetical protein
VVHALGFHAFFPSGDDRAAIDAAIDAALRDSLGLVLVSAIDGPWWRRTYGHPTSGRPPIDIHFDFSRAPSWSQVMVYPITREASDAYGGADGFRRLVEAIASALPLTVGRTFRHGGFALVRDAELTGGVDALDWGQFFDDAIARRLASRDPAMAQSPEWSAGPRDGRWLWFALDPWAIDIIADKRLDRLEQWAARLGITLRAWPEHIRVRRADIEERTRSIAPDAPAWDIGASRRAMTVRLTSVEHDTAIAPYTTVERALVANEIAEPVASSLLDAAVYLEIGLLELAAALIVPIADAPERRDTMPPLVALQRRVHAAIAAREWPAVLDVARGLLKAIAILGGEIIAHTIVTDDDVARIDAFLATYAPSIADRRALEQLAHWQRFYGRDPDAVRIVLRVLASKPEVALPALVHLDTASLEGLLKMAAWGRATYEEAEVREIVLETLMSDDPSVVLHYARTTTKHTVIGGMLALQRGHIANCPKPACARRRERLATMSHAIKETPRS